MNEKELSEIKINLMKNKKFREELSINLIREILENNEINIKESEVNKKVKRIVKELIDIKFQEHNIWIEN
ncbi:MAG: hypothetical protein N3E38_00870 [Candidatus Aenigmarchaeota archaeon]|nr:hypothetical protein [Candidatus Aenigmarchaeota archaeon]MCX8179277.1 hypothetical protein [Candidatus Aenigmarchaeota archaeon]